MLGDAAVNGITVMAFIYAMATAYSWSDLVRCRAGALTVAEWAIMARPPILVPLLHAIDDHPIANARSLSNPGGALLITQENFSKSELYKALQGYIAHPKRLPVMAKAAASVAQQKATSLVSDHCEELINDR